MYGKLNIPTLLTGTESSRRDSHSLQMKRHIRYSSLSRALYPKDEYNGAGSNPVKVDMLAVEAEKEFGWKYPSAETIRTYQDYRGLSTEMLTLSGLSSEINQRSRGAILPH